MKTRNATNIAVALIAIGIIVCIVAFGFGVGNFKKNYKLQSFVKTYDNNINTENINSSNLSVENISFDIDCGNIEIVEGDVFQLEVIDAIEDTVKQSVENNTLTVTQHNPSNSKWKFNFWFLNNSDDEENSINTIFKLTVPKNTEFENVEFKTNVGNITAYEITCADFSCDIDVGSVNIDNLTCQKTEIDSDVASVALKNAKISNCDITSDVGDIEIKGIITGKNEISTNVGDLKLDLQGDINDYSFSVDKGIGDVEINDKEVSSLENSSASNTFKIKHDIGDVDITIK